MEVVIMNTARPRITARVDTDTQNLLTQAAAIAGMPSLNSFVLNAAIEKAKKIMDRERSLKLSRRDALMLVEALDTPPKINVRLQKASQRYKGKNQL